MWKPALDGVIQIRRHYKICICIHLSWYGSKPNSWHECAALANKISSINSMGISDTFNIFPYHPMMQRGVIISIHFCCRHCSPGSRILNCLSEEEWKDCKRTSGTGSDDNMYYGNEGDYYTYEETRVTDTNDYYDDD